MLLNGYKNVHSRQNQFGCESIVFGECFGGIHNGIKWSVCEIYKVKPIGDCKGWTKHDAKFKLLWSDAEVKRPDSCH